MARIIWGINEGLDTYSAFCFSCWRYCATDQCREGGGILDLGKTRTFFQEAKNA
jgi:hypothetical protein